MRGLWPSQLWLLSPVGCKKLRLLVSWAVSHFQNVNKAFRLLGDHLGRTPPEVQSQGSKEALRAIWADVSQEASLPRARAKAYSKLLVVLRAQRPSWLLGPTPSLATSGNLCSSPCPRAFAHLVLFSEIPLCLPPLPVCLDNSFIAHTLIQQKS